MAANHDTRERLITYLVAGATQAQAAAALGISESYVSDMHAEDSFKEELASRKMAALESSISTENQIKKVESLAITKLEKLMPTIMDPMKALAIFKVTNAARISQTVVSNPAVAATAIVNLHLPTVLLQNYKADSSNRIISINDTPMITLQSANVERLSDEHDRTKLSKIEHKFNVPVSDEKRSYASHDLAEFGLA
jgi:hypothetical protein